jgi:hypothetical protein
MTDGLKPLPRIRVGKNKDGSDKYGIHLRPFMTKLLDERTDIAHNNSHFLSNESNWVSENTYFYDLRNMLKNLGYNINERYGPEFGKEREGKVILDHIRKSIVGMVKDYCDQKHITRRSIGVYADERANMYFRGWVTPISYDIVEELAEYGVDILLVEKPNIVRKIAPYASRYGIALIECGGNFVEYALETIEEAKTNGRSNIETLTDCDISGIQMCMLCRFAIRIGITPKIFDELGISMDKRTMIEEAYNPSENQEKFVRETVGAFHGLYQDGSLTDEEINCDIPKIIEWDRYDKTEIRNYNLPLLKELCANNFELFKYVRNNRIELDILIKEIGPKVFWEYILQKLKEAYPNRDYNRSIDIPELMKLPPIQKFFRRLERELTPVYSSDREKVVKSLSNTNGVLLVKAKETQINKRFVRALYKEPHSKEILKTLRTFDFGNGKARRRRPSPSKSTGQESSTDDEPNNEE